MLTKLVPAVLVVALAPQALATAKTTQTLIQEIDVQPANGGFNPDAFAYDLTAKVLVGGNACEAKGIKASLVQKKSGDTIVVTPMKTVAKGKRICPRVWDPIYATVKATVRGFSSQVDDVVIRNIEELGAKTSVSTLLDQGTELSFSGVLGTVMAIGGESTGVALTLPTGESVELDLQTNNLDHGLLELDGQSVNVQGVYKTVTGVEIPTRRVLEVSSIELAQ